MAEKAISPEVLALVERIREVRHDIPEFKKNDVETKNLINAYHNTQTELLMRVQSLMGFDTYGETLTFVDKQIKSSNVA